MNKIADGIRENRNELFGLSIITIIIFHYFEDVGNSQITGALHAAARVYTFLIGSAGVEFFLFLSGMGLFYSMSRSPKILSFYKKRLLRVVPAYLLIGTAGWIALDILIEYKGIRALVRDLSTLSFWLSGERLVWYISFILLMYLLFPLVFRLLDNRSEKVSAARLIGLIAAAAIGLLLAWRLFPAFYKNTEIALWRIIIFLLGAWYGKQSVQGKPTGRLLFTLAAAGIAVKLAAVLVPSKADFPLSLLRLRINNLLYPVALLLAASAILTAVKGKRFKSALRLFGSCSLELYLSHVLLRRIFKSIGLPTSKLWFYLPCIAASVAAAFAVNKLLGAITRKKANESG